MYLTRDALTMIRRFMNDTDFYHLLVCCQTYYRHFDWFCMQTSIKQGRWLGATLRGRDIKHIVAFNHENKFNEFINIVSPTHKLIAYILKGAIHSNLKYFKLGSNEEIANEFLSDLGYVENQKNNRIYYK